MKGPLVMVVVLLSVACVNAHSWMQCADYTEENGQFWDASKCRAWPRGYFNAFQYQGYGFGADAGFNYIPSDAKPCQGTYSDGSYTATYPAATYAPGQRVCLAWPPKNHVAAKCNNPNIPDSGTRIYRSSRYTAFSSTDPTLTQFYTNLVWDFGKNTVAGEGVAFQNCPNFCAEADKALCTGCFDIPTNLETGKYTFLWEWDFNNAADKYTTCWDITIANQAANKVTALAHIGPDAYAAAKAGSLTVASGAAATSGSSSGTATGNANESSSGSGSGSSSGSSGSKSYAGNVAAAVILTFLATTVLAAGLIFYAGRNPTSRIGSIMHSFMGAPSQARRDPLMQTAY